MREEGRAGGTEMSLEGLYGKGDGMDGWMDGGREAGMGEVGAVCGMSVSAHASFASTGRGRWPPCRCRRGSGRTRRGLSSAPTAHPHPPARPPARSPIHTHTPALRLGHPHNLASEASRERGRPRVGDGPDGRAPPPRCADNRRAGRHAANSRIARAPGACRVREFVRLRGSGVR